MGNIKISILILASILFVTCEQSDPPGKDKGVNTETFGRIGDSIRFSGRDWTVKIHEASQWGPGPNYFSGHEEDIFVDAQGYLHMKIVNRGGKWMSTEVVSDENLGYGTYIFTLDGDFENIPENIVLGLFTWDNTTFKKEANSEVDIEISKWGNKNDLWTLQYGVQPINFGQLNPERMFRPEYTLGKLKGVTTHGFKWSENEIVWNSYAGDTYGSGELLGTWTFDLNNPARVKTEGGQNSEAIIIPKPGPETNARINLWITPWVAAAPTDGKEQEMIIRRFEYRPL